MSTGPRAQTGPAFVPLARPDMGEAELSAIAEVIASGWLTTGPRVKAFEAAFAQHVGAAEAVALELLHGRPAPLAAGLQGRPPATR